MDRGLKDIKRKANRLALRMIWMSVKTFIKHPIEFIKVWRSRV